MFKVFNLSREFMNIIKNFNKRKMLIHGTYAKGFSAQFTYVLLTLKLFLFLNFVHW